MIEQAFTGLGAVAALFAAGLWIVACRAEVPAPPQTSGVGSLLDAYLISLNPKGERIDLIGTTKKQARWNSRAALAAAITAGFGFCAALAHILGK